MQENKYKVTKKVRLLVKITKNLPSVFNPVNATKRLPIML